MFHHNSGCLTDKTKINIDYSHLSDTREEIIIDFLSKIINILIKNKPS